MIRKIMKRKRWMMALAGAGCAVIAGTSGLKAAAAAHLTSTGSLVAENGKVTWYSSDTDYLNREISMLRNETDCSALGLAEDNKAASASIGRRRGLLNSRGAIDYDNGKVIINADDLFRLADDIDTLESRYRAVTCGALGRIGTYYDTDGNAGHVGTEGANAVLPDRTQLVAGILQSQSVEHTAAVPITPDNVTAGTAAWVNGRCILGNGADNERAYRRGMEDGRTGNDGDMDIQCTCHTHVDGSGNGPIEDGNVIYTTDDPGGCYRAGGHSHNKAGTCKTKKETTTEECGLKLKFRLYGTADFNHTGAWFCDEHGDQREGVEWDGGGICDEKVTKTKTVYDCGEPTNTWKIGCGKKAGEVESVTIIIHGNSEKSE